MAVHNQRLGGCGDVSDAVLDLQGDVVDLDGADVTGQCAGVVLQVELLGFLDIERSRTGSAG